MTAVSQIKSNTPFSKKKGDSKSATAGTAVEVVATSARVPTFGRNNIELEFRPVLIRLWQELS